MATEKSGWTQWSQYVLKELERNNSDHESMSDKLDKIAVEIAMLKVKSGMWGTIGGLVSAAVFLLVNYIKK